MFQNSATNDFHPVLLIHLQIKLFLKISYFVFLVNRLREHWDETSQSVLQRKSQLTNMLGDSQRYVFDFFVYKMNNKIN